MFIDTRTKDELNSYKRLLKVIGSLSNLFADTSVPYINSRVSENLFCRVFSAKNLSRSDVSADACVNNVGIGIKTFIEGNGKTIQKVAEFNKDKKRYSGKNPIDTIKTVSLLRNERLDATKRIHGLTDLYYHCVTRKKGLILAYDTDMYNVDIESICDVEEKDNVIRFNDTLNEYSFNISKSTLYKRFNTPNALVEVSIEIIKDPFEALEQLLTSMGGSLDYEHKIEPESILLPLYSDGSQDVPEKSQLNQWNAGGRARDNNEIYIQIPSWIHKKFPNFFPSRDIPFEMELPNGEIMSVKVCQDGSKALMSNPNKALGKWLLRDVLNLNKGEILKYDRLKIIGLDSVVINKISAEKYSINFAKVGSFETFKSNNN